MTTTSLSPQDVVLVEGVRTPFVKAGLDFKDCEAAYLGQIALQKLIYKANLNVEEVEEAVIGNTANPVESLNIARVIALNAGLPTRVPAYTVHRNCASGLQSVTSAYEKIQAGCAQVVIAGGVESMSRMPFLFGAKMTKMFTELFMAKSMWQRLGALSRFRLSHLKPIIALKEGLTDPFVKINMGQTAEILAKEFHISRGEQDRFALQSHQRAWKATKEGRLKEETGPVFLFSRKQVKLVDQDIGPRKGQTMEALSKLRPYFDRRAGTVTVGNACPITDGAAMLLLMSRERARALGYKPRIRLRSYAYAALEPERMGLGPAYSIPLALDRAGLKLKDIRLLEINEAFAAQVLACKKALESDGFAREKLQRNEKVGEVDENILNVNGGAIALGHPVGATGARLVLTLMREMLRRENCDFGLASLCIGGGQGGALVLEREN